MPRLARLDAPGVLHHVMGRGIERRKIFWNDKDRNDFIDRLAGVVEQGGMDIYAWTLIPNHFHLLCKTKNWPLSTSMRRILTGYVVNFNKRHKRRGHLFQNRYKSIVCQEDSYLKELVRYIHLNLLRSGIVKDMRELNHSSWSGHSALARYKRVVLDHNEPLAKALDAKVQLGNIFRSLRMPFRQDRVGLHTWSDVLSLPKDLFDSIDSKDFESASLVKFLLGKPLKLLVEHTRRRKVAIFYRVKRNHYLSEIRKDVVRLFGETALK